MLEYRLELEQYVLCVMSLCTNCIVSIVAITLMAILFMNELSRYLTVEVTPVLSVDTSREGKMKIFMDITFPSLPCICMLLPFHSDNQT